MDIYRILKNFDAVNGKPGLNESMQTTASLNLAEDTASKDKDKEKEKKPPFPGSPEYEKKYGKPKHDDDSAFHKKKVSTGTVYSRKHKEEPEADDEDDTPKKKGRPAGTKKKIGAKGPSTTSKLIKDGPKKAPSKAKKKVKEGLDIEDQGEYDDEAGMARQDLHTVVDAAKELHDILASDENLPEWVQAKITKALDYIDTSRDYVKSSHADRGDEEIDEVAPAAASSFKKGDKVIANGAPAIVYNIDAANGIAYVQYDQDLAKGSPQTHGVVLNQLKPAAAPAAAAASSFKKGDKVVANGAPAIVYNIDAANNTAYVQYEADLAKGSPQTQAVVLNQLKPAGVAEAGYSAKAARAGKDIGKPGKNFAKIAKSSGGGEKGQRIAGAVLNKLRHRNVGEEELLPSPSLPPETGGNTGRINSPMKPGKPPNESKVSEVTADQLDQQKMAQIMAQMKRAAATRANSRRVQQQPPSGGPRRSDIPAGIRKARGDAPLGRDEMGETSMGGTVAGGMAPAPGAKTFAEASSGSHEVAWKAAAKAVNAIMKKRGYTGSKTDEGYMWTKQTPRGTAFVDIDFDERWPDEVRWGEGELKGAKRKDYYQSGNDNVRDLAQIIGELFANVKLGQSGMDEADEDGKKDKPNFAKKDGKHKPDDDGDGVPDWADKKPGSDDNEESDDSNDSDDESDDDKELKLMKSRAGVEDKDDSDDKESDDDSDNKPKKGKKPDFGKSDDKESDKDDSDSDDDSEDNESDDKDDSDDKKESKDESADKPKKSGGMNVGTGVYESAFNKSLRSQLREGINMNSSQDSDGKKSVTVTATDEDAESLGDLLKMAGLFSSEGYSSVCHHCGGIHEADACGADHVEEAYGDFDIATNRNLSNSPDEEYTDADYMTQTLSGGLNGPKTTGQTTIPVINRQNSRQGVMAETEKVTEQAKSRLWNMYKQYDKK